MPIFGKASLSLCLLSLALTACTTPTTHRLDFARMNAVELVEYNRSVDFWDQVYCVDEIRAGSHIRRRHCNTLLEIQTQIDRSASAVNVLSATNVY